MFADHTFCDLLWNEKRDTCNTLAVAEIYIPPFGRVKSIGLKPSKAASSFIQPSTFTHAHRTSMQQLNKERFSLGPQLRHAFHSIGTLHPFLSFSLTEACARGCRELDSRLSNPQIPSPEQLTPIFSAALLSSSLLHLLFLFRISLTSFSVSVHILQCLELRSFLLHVLLGLTALMRCCMDCCPLYYTHL